MTEKWIVRLQVWRPKESFDFADITDLPVTCLPLNLPLSLPSIVALPWAPTLKTSWRLAVKRLPLRTIGFDSVLT